MSGKTDVVKGRIKEPALVALRGIAGAIKGFLPRHGQKKSE